MATTTPVPQYDHDHTMHSSEGHCRQSEDPPGHRREERSGVADAAGVEENEVRQCEQSLPEQHHHHHLPPSTTSALAPLQIGGHGGRIFHCMFSTSETLPASTILLTASEDSTCRLWNFCRAEESKTEEEESANEGEARSDKYGRTVLPLDALTIAGTQRFCPFPEQSNSPEILRCSFHSSANIVATGAADGCLSLFQANLHCAPGREEEEIVTTEPFMHIKHPGEDNQVYICQFSPWNKNEIISGCSDMLFCWDFETGQELSRLQFKARSSHILGGRERNSLETCFLFDATMSADKRSGERNEALSSIYVALSDGSVRNVDKRCKKEVSAVSGHEVYTTSVCCSLDGRYLLSTGGDGTLVGWDIRTWEPLYSCRPSTTPLYGSRFLSTSAEGNRALAWSSSGDILCFNPLTGDSLGAITLQDYGILSGDFDPETSLLAICGEQRASSHSYCDHSHGAAHSCDSSRTASNPFYLFDQSILSIFT